MPVSSQMYTAPLIAATASMHTLARQDPYAFLDLCITRSEDDIRDYRCVFTKREQVNGKLRPLMVNKVLYRDQPFSVYMIPQGSDRPVRRALYIEGAMRNRHGVELMRVEPNGWRRVFASEASIPIDDKRILAKNRSSIDQFGFKKMLKRFQAVNARALAAGDLDLRYAGSGEIDQRPTIKLIRQLPYTGAGSLYPDAKVIMHIDEHWLIPVSIQCYADQQGRTLLGSYQFTDVEINPGLTDAAFKF